MAWAVNLFQEKPGGKTLERSVGPFRTEDEAQSWCREHGLSDDSASDPQAFVIQLASPDRG